MSNVQDVSGDPSMLDWLRNAGHGHLLSQQNDYNNIPAHSPSPPIIPSGRISADPYGNSYNQSASFTGTGNANTQSYSHPQSPVNFGQSPTQFIAPHMNQPYDADIEVKKSNIYLFFYFFVLNK